MAQSGEWRHVTHQERDRLPWLACTLGPGFTQPSVPVSGPGTEGQTQGSGPPLPLGACSHPVHPLLRNIPGVLPDPTTDAVLQAGPGPGLGGDTRARSGGKSTEFIRNADSMAPPQSSCMETPQGWAQLT